MTTEKYKPEVAAIDTMLEHLGALDGPARSRVLDYVVRALDISLVGIGVSGRPDDPPLIEAPLIQSPPIDMGYDSVIKDIRSLHDEKQPSNAIEMATIVAYYLAELASENERKDTVAAADLEKYFKQAKYPLPARMSNIINATAGAGYIDQVDRGRYRLNPVGHNLVVHGLPSTGAKKTAAKKTPAKKTAAKKTPAKKAS